MTQKIQNRIFLMAQDEVNLIYLMGILHFCLCLLWWMTDRKMCNFSSYSLVCKKHFRTAKCCIKLLNTSFQEDDGLAIISAAFLCQNIPKIAYQVSSSCFQAHCHVPLNHPHDWVNCHLKVLHGFDNIHWFCQFLLLSKASNAGHHKKPPKFIQANSSSQRESHWSRWHYDNERGQK